jgi:hypothetical protein
MGHVSDAGAADRVGRRLRRLRWRLRGAWLWPTFALTLVADVLLLRFLPIAGNGGTDPVAAFLLAGCLNIAVVAALGGLGGWVLRRRRPDLPKVVADDKAGTTLLLCITLALFGLGLAHRPALQDRSEDLAAQASAAHRWFANQAPAAFRRNIGLADSLQVAPDLWRTCVPGDGTKRSLCIYLDTSDRPVTVKRDTSGASNAAYDPSGGFRP